MAMQFAQARRAQTPDISGAMAQQAQIANELRGAEQQANAQRQASLLGAGVNATTAGLEAATAAGAGGLAGTLGAMGPVGWAGLAALGLGSLL